MRHNISRKHKILCGLGLAGLVSVLLPLNAAEGPKFLIWTSSHIDSIQKSLPQKLDATKASHEDFVTGSFPSANMFYREASGRGEVHEKLGDFGVVRSGNAAMMYGGKLADRKANGAGQWYGTIEGGSKQTLSTGDLFYVPANMPHQWIVETGQKLYVELIKIAPHDMAKESTTKYMHWSAAQLKGVDAKLKSTVDATKSSHENLVESENLVAVMLHREGNGGSEAHENLADYDFIRSGEGTMILGGSVTGGKSTGPGEIRGAGIDGGTRQKVSAGDLLYIPANMPHQFEATPGKQFDVLVVKGWAR